MLEYRIMKGRNLKEDNMIKNSHCKPEKITCHAERQIDLRVSEFHNTETLKRVQGDMLQSPRSLWERVRVRGQNRGTVNSRVDFSLPETNGLPRSLRSLAMTKAFTLAEVLITLGIIGIVSAMTMPALIQNHRKHVVETRLKKFYSTINQAVTRSKAENGDVQNWFEDIYGSNVADKQHEYFMQYIGKYLNIIKTEERTTGNIYYLSDGSSFALSTGLTNGRDWVYSPGDLKVCLQKYGNNNRKYLGICAFAFMFTSDRGFRTYDAGWNGTETQLKNNNHFGCYNGSWHTYCTRLIQYNGWKIPDDYPYRVMIY